MGLGERVKSRLSQALIRDARPDSNSRPAVQISSPLPSRYAFWDSYNTYCQRYYTHEGYEEEKTAQKQKK